MIKYPFGKRLTGLWNSETLMQVLNDTGCVARHMVYEDCQEFSEPTSTFKVIMTVNETRHHVGVCRLVMEGPILYMDSRLRQPIVCPNSFFMDLLARTRHTFPSGGVAMFLFVTVVAELRAAPLTVASRPMLDNEQLLFRQVLPPGVVYPTGQLN
jgi:hypothetical protein